MPAGPLVSVSELRDLLPHVTVLDVRYRMGDPRGRERYAAAHLPGAVYVDLDEDLASPPGGRGRHPLPTPEAFQVSMRRVGVRTGRPVVVYDDWSGHAAARAWWLLRHHGLTDVRVLDGVLSAWREAALPLESGWVEPPPGDVVLRPGSMPVVDVGSVASVPVLVDARAAERYLGEVEPVDPVAGHVPGALSVPTATNLGPDGRFRPADELRAAYAEVGAVEGADVAVYCGSGVTAAHDVLALEVAGVRAALYPGSWSEWVADPSRPVAVGRA